MHYLSRLLANANLGLMRRIDKLHMRFPFGGSRMLRDMIKLECVRVGRKHVRAPMERVAIAASIASQHEYSASRPSDLYVGAADISVPRRAV
jgi:hypothetical protein